MTTSLLDFTEVAAKNNLEQVMAKTLEKSGTNRFAVRAICLGVSGVNHHKDRQWILNWLRLIFEFDIHPSLLLKVLGLHESQYYDYNMSKSHGIFYVFQVCFL